MRKCIIHLFLYIALIIGGLIIILGLGIISIPLLFPDHPNDWGWLEEYSSDQETFTMQEAYTLIQPVMTEWNEDSYITEASAGFYPIPPDGRTPYWRFAVCSQKAGEWVAVVVNKGKVGLGRVTDKPWGDIGYLYNCYPLRIGDVIDSDDVYQIVKEHITDLSPSHLSLRNHRVPLGDHISWGCSFYSDEESISINIDAYNGSVLEISRRIDGRDEIMEIDWKR